MSCFWVDLRKAKTACPEDFTYGVDVWDMSAYNGVYKMALSPTRMIVSNEFYGSNLGRVWILDLNGNLLATVQPSGYGSTVSYGSFLSYDGTNFWIGALAADYGGYSDRGVIDVVDVSGVWQARMTTSTPAALDYFGTQACSNGTNIFAPAYYNSKLMKFNSSYAAVSQTAMPGGYGTERQQTAVIAGGYLVTGGYTADYGGYSRNGILRVWDTTPTFQRLCIHPHPNNDAFMGRPLESTGTYAVAGAWGTTVSGVTLAGMVLFFDPSNGNCVRTLTMTNAGLPLESASYFGRSLYYHAATSSLFITSKTAVCEFLISGSTATHVKNYTAEGQYTNSVSSFPSEVIANSTHVYVIQQSTVAGNILVWTR